MKLNDIRVGYKVWGAILGLLLILIGAASITLLQAGAAMERAVTEVKRYEGKITSAVEWHGLVRANSERSLATMVSSDPVSVKFFTERQTAGTATIGVVNEKVVKLADSPEEKAALDKVVEVRTKIRATTAKVPDLRNSGDAEALRKFALEEFLPISKAYEEALADFIKVEERLRDRATEEATAARHRALLMGVVSAVLVVVAAIVTALMLSRSITRPLIEAVASARAISGGDLTQTLNTRRKDEFGELLQALADMTERLRGLVSQVRTGVDSVSTASTEIANGNQDLSARTEQTASNLQETAASMEELTSTVSQSADTARQANQLATTAATEAQRGGTLMEQVVQSMQLISDSSKKIADIIGVIDGIAFQTNILALNAAVEAARAGEQGRGFAVVASEVRALAGRSAEAAKEIKALIHASVQTVDTGSAQVGEAGAAMGEIVNSVRRVSDLIGEITSSTTEQRDGIGQVNQAVANLDQMTQQNAALVEESAAAASALRDQAQRLAEVVSIFNVGTQAGSYAAAPPARSAPLAAVCKPHSPVAATKPRPVPAAALPAAPAKAPAGGKVAEDDWESF